MYFQRFFLIVQIVQIAQNFKTLYCFAKKNHRGKRLRGFSKLCLSIYARKGGLEETINLFLQKMIRPS